MDMDSWVEPKSLSAVGWRACGTELARSGGGAGGGAGAELSGAGWQRGREGERERRASQPYLSSPIVRWPMEVFAQVNPVRAFSCAMLSDTREHARPHMLRRREEEKAHACYSPANVRLD